jgi:hypothetical protein
MTYHGECFCGAVKVEATGAPEGMGYCHCDSCRSWSASPVNAFTLWRPENIRIVSGSEFVASFNKTLRSERMYCTKCGAHLMTNHPLWNVIDVYAATLPTLAYKPALHINYAETVLPMKDGLPKFKDYPGAFGGSDLQLPE